MTSVIRSRLLSVAALAGAALLVLGTYMHPSHADPNVATAAFTEYAASQFWLASHLLQLGGLVAMMAALILLSREVADGPAESVANLAAYGAGASIALGATLQAVDGVALKAMINAWAASSNGQRDALFQATFAVRQIEIGLASMLSLVLGATISIYGIAQLLDSRFPKWLAFSALAGGASALVSGYVTASTGFSDLAMMISMPSSLVMLAWIVGLAMFWWSNSAQWKVRAEDAG